MGWRISLLRIWILIYLIFFVYCSAVKIAVKLRKDVPEKEVKRHRILTKQAA